MNKYLSEMEASVPRHFAQGGRYSGKEGALQLARDLGSGLACFPADEVNRVLGSLYSRMLVKYTFSCRGSVPVDAKPFIAEIRREIEKQNI